jgi:ribulose kinase
MLAAAACGIHGDIKEAAEAMSGEGARYEPDEKNSAFYDRLYNDVYKEIYPSLKHLFPKLTDAMNSTE